VANASGIDNLLDVLLTFDLRVRTRGAARRDAAEPPKTVRRQVLISAARRESKKMTELQAGAAPVTLTFSLRELGLSRRERDGRVANSS